MKNPWEDIGLDDYEAHMRLDSVMQLQAMNSIMKEQFEAYDVTTAMILGIAGGNGLEHVDPAKYRKVVGVDVNEAYLKAVTERYASLKGVLECLHLDVVKDARMLPKTELVIANLVIEYIGYAAFQNAIQQAAARVVSCVIQINADEGAWVSESPYLHAFDGLAAIHHPMKEGALTAAMNEIGYSKILQSSVNLPNGKALKRLDYARTNPGKATSRGQMIIRKATEADVRQIAEILVEDWKTAYKGIMDSDFLDSMSVEQRCQIEGRRYQKYVVAVDGEEVLGYAWNEMIDDDAADCEIVALYVRYSKRRSGIGRALLLNSMEYFRKSGKKRMIIWCLEANDEARKFYEKMGGKKYKTGTHRWGDRDYPIVSYLYPLEEYHS